MWFVNRHGEGKANRGLKSAKFKGHIRWNYWNLYIGMRTNSSLNFPLNIVLWTTLLISFLIITIHGIVLVGLKGWEGSEGGRRGEGNRPLHSRATSLCSCVREARGSALLRAAPMGRSSHAIWCPSLVNWFTMFRSRSVGKG